MRFHRHARWFVLLRIAAIVGLLIAHVPGPIIPGSGYAAAPALSASQG